MGKGEDPRHIFRIYNKINVNQMLKQLNTWLKGDFNTHIIRIKTSNSVFTFMFDNFRFFKKWFYQALCGVIYSDNM